MGGKIDIYNLGLLGVNVDASPIHLNDGEVIRAQNWQVDPAGVAGGLRRRDGHVHLNATPLDGAVTGVVGVALPDRSLLARKFYLPYSDAAASNITWRTSTDTVTWTDITTGSKPQQRGDLGATIGVNLFSSGALRWATLNNKIYYPAHDYVGLSTYPTIHVFDGTNDYVLTYILPSPFSPTTVPIGILSIVPYSANALIVSTYDATGGVAHGRVLLLNVTNGQLTQIGPQTDLPLCLCPLVYGGRIWISNYNGSGGSPSIVRWALIDDESWTIDKDMSDATFTDSSHGYTYGMASFKGDLYVGFGADVFGHGCIRKRSTIGTWTEVHTSDGTGGGNYCGPFIVSQDGLTLYAFQWSVSGGASPIGRILKTTDGTVWTQDYSAGDVSGVQHQGQPILDPDGSGDIIWCMFDASGVSTGRVVRNRAGVYSTRDTNLNYRGPICYLKV